jgi:hypothetical protein
MKNFLFITTCLAAVAVSGCEQSRDVAPTTLPESSTPLSSVPIRRHESKARPTGILPLFRMIGRESGFDFERYDDMRGLHRILEVNGGGVGLIDFDRDGRLDVFMTNGSRLPLNEDDRSTRCEFFANRGAMQFGKVTDETGLIQHGYNHGCAVGDYDNDGFEDLYVTAYGHNSLWHNNGDGTFVDATRQTATDVSKWSSSAAFADLNGDGNLDLYVVNYLRESDGSPKLCPKEGSPDGYEQCPPAMFEGADDVLFLSNGGGQFIDATEFSGVSNLRGKGLGIVVCDLDRDGQQEIFVANDGQANFLFVPSKEASDASPASGGQPTVKGFKYEERALLCNVALSEAGYAQANMGIAAGDYDANGTTDLFITHFYADTSTLYSNQGGLLFADATRSSNLGAPSRNRLGWGAAFCDNDNNGWLDLIVVNGHVDDRTWMKHGEPYKMRAQIFRNDERGTLSDVSDWGGEYFQKEWLGRALGIGDLDRDGRQDVVISHQLAPSNILRNETPTTNLSLVLKLVGTSSNRDGYGVRVEILDGVPIVARDLIGGGSFQAASATEVHLGLGENRSASIKVYWPSGLTETYQGLTHGRWILVEGKSHFSTESSKL